MYLNECMKQEWEAVLTQHGLQHHRGRWVESGQHLEDAASLYMHCTHASTPAAPWRTWTNPVMQRTSLSTFRGGPDILNPFVYLLEIQSDRERERTHLSTGLPIK